MPQYSTKGLSVGQVSASSDVPGRSQDNRSQDNRSQDNKSQDNEGGQSSEQYAAARPTTGSWSDAYRQLESQQVVWMRWDANDQRLYWQNRQDNAIHSTSWPEALLPDLIDFAREGVSLQLVSRRQAPWWQALLILLLPVGLLIAALVWMHRRQNKTAAKGPAFGSNKLTWVSHTDESLSFKDVAGQAEAKAELQEIVDFLKEPDRFHRLGAQIPRGVLLAGLPGTGKTRLARAVAGEAGVPFIYGSGSDFIEMFVGVGASRVRDLFKQARQQAPAIVFLDEIDALGRQRATASGFAAHEEREQALNALLVEMDGFSSSQSGVVIIAATNRSDTLDRALLRPGRFDRNITVNLPDVHDRAKILALHAASRPVAPSVDYQTIAQGTPGFSGADLANIVNEAALKAVRHGRTRLEAEDFEWARDKLLMGLERAGGLVNEQDRRIVAYHEAGHAVVSYLIPGTDPVHRISILPRGKSLGVTLRLPLVDRENVDKARLFNDLVVLMGGRAAEQVMLDTQTVGAADDLKRATHLARQMVAAWGMSDLGPTVLSETSQIDGRGLQGSAWSDQWRQQVDKTVSQLLKDSLNQACELVASHRTLVDNLAQALLDKETLDHEAFAAIMTQSATDNAPEPGAEC